MEGRRAFYMFFLREIDVVRAWRLGGLGGEIFGASNILVPNHRSEVDGIGCAF